MGSISLSPARYTLTFGLSLDVAIAAVPWSAYAPELWKVPSFINIKVQA